ncbi:tetratricopeptide repeat protein [Marinicella sp. W31]|uniref:tetratricopeptide repeat protein n=1 Tax=Marinicella sp. W31 TaxID=3023713 RepID=UPI00375751E9
MKILVIMLFLGTVVAEPYQPEHADMVLLSWSQELMAVDTSETLKQRLKNELQQAQKPGYSYLYGVAESRLAAHINNSQDSEEWLLWAQIMQHTHNFETAKAWLNKVLTVEPQQPQAHLLQAQIAVLEQDFDVAKSSCLRLLGGSDITTASVCLLQVASHQGQLLESYEKLSQVWSQMSDSDYRLWVVLILSDMAERMGEPTLAEYWLEQMPLQDSSISHIQAWADIKLKNGQAQEVLSELHRLKKELPSLEDGLLLRLAMAQKYFNLAAKHNNNPWRQEVARKIRLREQRQDVHHAKDMALYYLEFTSDKKRALYWAEINWQQSKEYADTVVLQRARKEAGVMLDLSQGAQL